MYFNGCGKLFNHNVHSVRVLQRLSKCNLSLQTLDGILCHCGEKAFEKYEPANLSGFEEFNAIIAECYFQRERIHNLRPSTLEGCVVRICDMIAYVGKDRQDAEKLKLCKMSDFHENILGNNNPKIISNITNDIISNSLDRPYISMSKDVYEALAECVSENYGRIYKCDEIVEPYYTAVKPMMGILYDRFLNDFTAQKRDSVIFRHHYDNRIINYPEKDGKTEPETSPHDVVVDFIASMTDDYFVKVFKYLYPTSELNSKVKYLEYFDKRYL